MDNKSENIKQHIKGKEKSFYFFIKNILDKESFSILESIAKETDVFIFSGVIRNFFIQKDMEFRDVDIVIRKNKQIEKTARDFITKLEIKKNSFGGYKIKINNMNVDVWYLQNTWGIKEEKQPPTSESLIKSSFFNFSAITFDFNKKEFLFLDDFCDFLENKYLDVVYGKNPNIPLCIVNSIYYSEKFNLKLGNNLSNWIVRNYSSEYDYDTAQLKHFGEIKYDKNQIASFYLSICKKATTKNNIINFKIREKQIRRNQNTYPKLSAK